MGNLGRGVPIGVETAAVEGTLSWHLPGRPGARVFRGGGDSPGPETSGVRTGARRTTGIGLSIEPERCGVKEQLHGPCWT